MCNCAYSVVRLHKISRMPRSRGRKKKKKKKQNRQKRNREVFRKNGIEVVREGKNIFIKNVRTPEEQKQFLESIKESRPKILESINGYVEQTIKIFEKFDNIKLLGALSSNELINSDNQTDDELAEVSLELGMSFSTAIQGNPIEEPSDRILHQLMDCLIEIRNGFNMYMMAENAEKKYTILEGQIRYKTILEALYVRGKAYKQHIYKIYSELFSGHDRFLIDSYSFDSNDILNTFLLLEDSLLCRIVFPDGMPHPSLHERFVQWSDTKTESEIKSSGMHFIDYFGAENPDIVVENSKVSGYSIDNIRNYDQLFKIKFREPFQEKVVKSISMNFGDNTGFLNPNFKGLPLNDSKVFTNPIIEQNGNYYLFAYSLPTRSLFEITEALIKKADKNYYNKKYLGSSFSLSRDNYLENKTAELFKTIMPGSSSYLNIKYKPGIIDEIGNLIETELDLLILSKKATYLIEMKAGGLSAPSRRGAIKSLKGQLKETVGYGAFQSYRALKYITEDPKAVFYTSSGKKIYIDNSLPIFRVTITLEHLSGLISYMYDLKEIGVIDKNVDFAWTCSIFDLIIFSEIIENESDFIEYLEKRIPLYQRPEMSISDEIDLLGYFLEEGLQFDEELLKGVTNFKLNKYSSDIDDYYERGQPKPKRKK